MNSSRIIEAINEARTHKSLGERLRSDQVELAPIEIAEMALCSLQRVYSLLSGRHYYDYNSQEWIDQDNEMMCVSVLRDKKGVVDEYLKGNLTEETLNDATS